MADSYDKNYEGRNYFGYREWLYRPYISTLLSVADLRVGSSILDVGCGQGFFSYLFRRSGMNVSGVDLSETGVRSARQLYGSLGITFIVGDVTSTSFTQDFDCVFVRSLSLYNRENFSSDRSVTDALLRLVRPGGTLLFLYNTNFKRRGGAWKYHSVDDVRAHFSLYRHHRVFFLTRIDALLFGRLAFNDVFLKLNSRVSSRFGVGGDLVCILKKK